MKKNDPGFSGVIVIDKHPGVTSHDVVSAVRRLYGTRSVGHTGTLDPMATGVLPVMVGRAVKAAEYLVCDSKRYLATVKFGLETDTEDVTGTVLSETGLLPSEDDVIEAARSFVGRSEQIPPMYSALKIGGKKLVDLAREGISVERQPRSIEIQALSVRPSEGGLYELDVSCSRGTYIRTLCADLGRKLGCGGVMASLRRIRSGNFDLSSAVTVAELEAMSLEERIAALIPVEQLFSDCPELELPDFFVHLAKNGNEIYLGKIGVSFPAGCYLRLKQKGAFFALGQVRDFPDGPAVKPVKQFEL